MNDNSNNVNKFKEGIIKFIIVILITYIALTISCITLGLMKKTEYEEYARTVENANITTVIGPLFFNGPTCIFVLAIITAIIARIFIKKDSQMRKILYFTPIYVCVLTIPTWLILLQICEYFNITF